MLEKDLNRIIANSLDWGYKIPDPPQQAATSSSKRPFDGFGILNKKPVYWESKFEKKLSSFNLKRLAEHQIEALDECLSIKEAHVWAIYGVHVGRGDFRVWVFDWRVLRKRVSDQKNILKRELENMPHYTVKKQLIDFDIDLVIGDMHFSS